MSDQLARVTPEQIEEARNWFNEYDGPKAKTCNSKTGEWRCSIGLNNKSDSGTRGIEIHITSIRETDVIVGLWLFWKSIQ